MNYKMELKLLELRNLIAQREFNTAEANHQLSQGGWRSDFEIADAQFGAKIDEKMKEIQELANCIKLYPNET